MYYPNLLLMGDCNLDFQKPDEERPQISAFLKSLNATHLSHHKHAKINFPFLDVHPDENQVYRTAARLEDTYDQIAIILRDKGLPDSDQNAAAGSTANGYNYGVFNFVELFSNALHGKNVNGLTEHQRKTLYSKFEYDVSDHMPVWIRLPLRG